jgi:probable rRNA maturation factor
MSRLVVRNRQRVVPCNTRLLRALARAALAEPELAPLRAFAELGVYLLDDPSMSALNRRHLGHAGPTDVISFDYGAGVPAPGGPVGRSGELCLGVPEAVRQARRYRTTWPAELARYLVHGLLHLAGHDDSRAAARRRMKRVEDRLVRRLGTRFDFNRLALHPWRRA